MAYKKSYTKKRYTPKKRRATFKRKTKSFRAKRVGRKMVQRQQNRSFKVSQTYTLNGSQYGNAVEVPFGLAFLNGTPGVPGMQCYNLTSPQNAQTTILNGQYDEYYISGMGLKINFPEQIQGTPNALRWGLAFDINSWIAPLQNTVSGNYFNALEGIGGFQGGTANSPGTVKRYWSTASIRKQLGIGMCKTGQQDYNNQLSNTVIPSINGCVVFDSRLLFGQQTRTSITVTYYYKYRGFNQVNAATPPPIPVTLPAEIAAE